jgi:hypothetical protein
MGKARIHGGTFAKNCSPETGFDENARENKQIFCGSIAWQPSLQTIFRYVSRVLAGWESLS